MPAKKGKTSAKKAAPKKKATPKKAATKKVAAKPAVSEQTKKAAAKKVQLTPRKGDIVVAFGKYYRVNSASKVNASINGTHLTMVECKMTGDLSRGFAFNDVTALYRGVK